MPGEILAYEQSSRPRRWRHFVSRWTRRLVLPALVIGIVAGGWWWREWIVDWAGWQMAMRGAWRHEMPPPGTLLLANAERGAALARESDDYVLDEHGFASYHPSSLRRLATYDWRYQNIELGNWSFPEPPPISFMGVMRRPDGQERLVVLTGGAANAFSLLGDVSVLVLPPPTLLGSERRGARQQFMTQRTGQLRMAVLHMARLDPEDEGRLLVPFSVYGNNTRERTSAGTLELRLGDDDVLRARIAEMSPADDQVACVDWVAMPQAKGLPHALAPWQAAGMQQMQKLQMSIPSEQPLAW